MGAYLSKPVTEKISECGENERVRYGATSMQGWRINQEDAHNCIVNYDDDCSFFAVYDGHGGCEVARYAANHLPYMLKSSNCWYSQNYTKAIQDTFLQLDELLRSDAVLRELKKLRGSVERKCPDSSDDDDDKQALYEEAGMPIEAILKRYGILFQPGHNGKEAVINFGELREQIEQDNEEMPEISDEDENEVEENGSSEGEKEIIEEGLNGDLMVLEEAEDHEKELLKQADERTVEEKRKKRYSESPRSAIIAKRIKSIDDMVSTDSCDDLSSKTILNDSELITKNEKTEYAIMNEVAASDSEVPGPAELSPTTVSGDYVVEHESHTEKLQLSGTFDGQTTFSSDSEQSVDEDYNDAESPRESEEEEEDSDGLVEKEDESELSKFSDTPGEDSGSTACIVILFKALFLQVCTKW
ncbi:unnamed protein product [Thelazia callipaeda]|uniref:protein-serine/threonine phosphatase n=1 Tax=Thelazia callipaeda TaxID=103827 RepID=A0A0N5CWX3_THECL|nr:unnamed protein product [Thelazia callipaeda]